MIEDKLKEMAKEAVDGAVESGWLPDGVSKEDAYHAAMTGDIEPLMQVASLQAFMQSQGKLGCEALLLFNQAWKRAWEEVMRSANQDKEIHT